MTFNLLVDAWLTGRRHSEALATAKNRDLCPIRDLFTLEAADPIVAIQWGRPDLDVATLELLIGILTVALDLRSEDDWKRLWNDPPQPADLQGKLDRFAPAFVLDGEGPRFMQDLEQFDAGVEPIANLMIDGAGGNTLTENKDVFANRDRFGADAVLSRGAAAMALFALQAFAPSGGKGHRTSLRGGGPLTTLFIPGALDGAAAGPLCDLLLANLDFCKTSAPCDATVFPWLAQTRRSEGEKKPTYHMESAGAHPAQAFFGMPRRLRLVFEENSRKLPCALTGNVDPVVATGFRARPYGVNYGRWTHPLTPYKKSQKGELLPMHAREGRASYADWAGLTLADVGTVEPARVVRQALARDVGNRAQPRLMVAGYAMDNAKALDFTMATVPLFADPDKARLEALGREAKHMVDAVDLAARELRSAVRGALFPAPSQGEWKIGLDATVLAPLRDRLLARTERAFEARMERLRVTGSPLESALDNIDAAAAEACRTWLTILQRHTMTLFDEAVPLDRLDSVDETAVARMVRAQLSLRKAFAGDAFRKIWGLEKQPKESKHKAKGCAT